jgi:hypothetical protein
MVHEAIIDVGGNPAAVTSSANLAALTSRGVEDAIRDPRVNLLQSLEAILVAELSDNACWETLIAVAEKAGQLQLASSFKQPLLSEAQHLWKVKQWLRNGHGLRK